MYMQENNIHMDTKTLTSVPQTVPDESESKIDRMMQDINSSYDRLSSHPSKKELEFIYTDLCQRRYFTNKLHKMYPFTRWKSCRKIRHKKDLFKVMFVTSPSLPILSRFHILANTQHYCFLKVRKDQQAWSCGLCHPRH